MAVTLAGGIWKTLVKSQNLITKIVSWFRHEGNTDLDTDGGGPASHVAPVGPLDSESRQVVEPGGGKAKGPRPGALFRTLRRETQVGDRTFDS